ncbi:MAG: heme-binding protein [Pseudomonadota bacterium]
MAIFGLALTGVVVLAGCAWVYMSSSIETPDYQVESSDGAIETRRYPAFVVAEVIRRGDRYTAVRNGFGPLAGYIFAKERAGEKIAMTAPVTQRRREEGAADWTVQFIMPAQYSLADLPAPVQGDVTLTEEPPARRAAIRFSGVATDELIAEQEGLLRAWLAEKGLTPLGAPIYAYYNDPFTPGFLRRNEVLIDLADG